MNVKKFVVGSVVGCMLGGVPVVSGTLLASANEVQNAEQKIDALILSEKTQEIANKYIQFNKQKNEFIIQNDLRTHLSNLEYQLVTKQVKETNNQIHLAVKDNSNIEIIIVDTDGTQEILASQLGRAYGKTAIKFYWNYARVWLSRGTLNNIGTGLAIGGVVIPHPVIKAAASIAGIVLGKASNGIWFDYNYYCYLVLAAGIQR